jgi:hypothetical protein
MGSSESGACPSAQDAGGLDGASYRANASFLLALFPLVLHALVVGHVSGSVIASLLSIDGSASGYDPKGIGRPSQRDWDAIHWASHIWLSSRHRFRSLSHISHRCFFHSSATCAIRESSHRIPA